MMKSQSALLLRAVSGSMVLKQQGSAVPMSVVHITTNDHANSSGLGCLPGAMLILRVE